MEILILGAVLGLIPGIIAGRKGLSFGGYWLFGTLLFIVALPVAILADPSEKTHKRCTECRTWIDRLATRCPKCGAQHASTH